MSIMPEDGLFQRAYEQYSTSRLKRAAADYIALLAAYYPNLRGSWRLVEGWQARRYLSSGVFTGQQKDCCLHISMLFTEISASFFDNARTKLSQWSGQLKYSKLDISQDPLLQGFSAESYDIVLASNVLYATPDMVETLEHARAVLRPPWEA